MNLSMADLSLMPSQAEIKEKFFEGFAGPYDLYIADSKMSGAGLGLFVREEVPAGKEVFRVAVPPVSAVDCSKETCDSCFAWTGSSDPFRTPIKLLVCVSCKTVRYCSKKCQRAAWRRYHREECKIYCDISARTPNTLEEEEDSSVIRMLIRLLILRQNGRVTDNQWQAILKLQSHKALIEQSKELDWAAIKADIRLVKQVTKDDMSEDDLEDLYWRIKINQHSVDSPLQPRLGSCLVPGAALINHSCQPNSHHLSEGPELVLRSCRTIAKDEEITISYIDATQSFDERQEALFTAYAFDCQCCRCTEGFEERGEILTGDPLHDTPIHQARSELHTLLLALSDYCQKPDVVEAKVRETCDSVSSTSSWPINVAPMPYIYVGLARRFEDEQQWEKALRYRLKVVYVIDPLRYPDRLNPHRVQDLFSLCQLESRIPDICATNNAVKACFHSIETSLSMAQYGRYAKLKEDATATLGANHFISKIAANFVETMDNQMMSSLGLTKSVCQMMREERFDASEHKLLDWAGIDLTA